jgi:hypothetical protein
VLKLLVTSLNCELAELAAPCCLFGNEKSGQKNEMFKKHFVILLVGL